MVFLGKQDYSDMSSVSSIVSSSDDEDAEHEIASIYTHLKLPWNDNYWNITITHVVAPNEVWATLTENAVMLHRIERVALMTLTPANRIIVGEMYLAKSDDRIHRVKAVKCFWIEKGLHCDCFFIDIGKIETIERNQLFACTNEYRNIEPQAICFKLFGFDELYHCPYIEDYVRAWLINKQFIGCLMMAEPQYQVQLNHGIRMPKVSIALFTFFPKFTLYKPILLKQIGASLPKPTFSHGMHNAKVSHVSPTGLVYFNLDERCIGYIDTLIQQFVDENQKQLHIYRLRQSTPTNCVVLIYDVVQNMYHRAKIIDTKMDLSSKYYKCHYIDSGETQSVAVSNIYTLSNTSILSYYPAQAVPAKLHMLETFEDSVYKRLCDILTNNVKVQVNVIDQNAMRPTVYVLKGSVNINELIHMELELYRYAADAAFPDSMF